MVHPIPVALRAGFALLALGLLAYVAHALVSGGEDGPFEPWLYLALMTGAAAVVLLRGALVPHERAAWLTLGAALAMYAAGDAVYDLHIAKLDPQPYPSVADAIYLASYPDHLRRAGPPPARPPADLAPDAVAGRRHRRPDRHGGRRGAGLRPGPGGDGGRPRDGRRVAGLPARRPHPDPLRGRRHRGGRRRAGRSWLLLGLGLGPIAVADTVFLFQEATGTYLAGTLIDALWPAGSLLMAAAAWQPRNRRERRADGWAMVALPGLFALAALGVLVTAHLRDVPDLAVGLAASAVLLTLVRGGITLRENVLLIRRSRREALEDGLTGLANRRALMADLEEAFAHGIAHGPRTLAFFDLDGFKRYNDAFGHAAGDALLARLGRRLTEVVAERGTAYRLGGDEFCVLLEGTAIRHGDARAAPGRHARRARGRLRGDELGRRHRPARRGSLARRRPAARRQPHVRREGRPPQHAGASRRATSCSRSSASASPSCAPTCATSAPWPSASGGAWGCAASRSTSWCAAPSCTTSARSPSPTRSCTSRPRWSRTSGRSCTSTPIIGERILAAAPALRAVGALVRSSHERWDGRGYPDRLAGEAIPLGARVIAVCDAYDAMRTDRAYRRACPQDEALAELRRCAGGQFDPAVVEAFCAEITAPAHRPTAVHA